MYRPGYKAEDLAARNALASEAALASKANASRVSPSQALAVVNKQPTVPQPGTGIAPTTPQTTTASIAKPLALPAPASANAPANAPKRPILTLQNGSIPNAINRINAPASNALNAASPTPTPSATVNAKPALGAPTPTGAAPKVTPAPTIYSAPGQPGSTADPQLAKQVQAAIDEQARIKAAGGPRIPAAPTAIEKAPGLASRALSQTGKLGSKVLQGAAKVAPLATAAYEAGATYNDVTTDGMTGIDQTARVAEGAGTVAGSLAGAGIGATLGLAGGPAAPITVPLGGIAGGLAGLLAPRAANEASNRMFGANNQLASDKAAQLRQAQQFDRGVAVQNALLTPAQIAERQSAAGTAKTPAEAAAIRSGEIPTFANGAGVTPAPTIEQRAAAAQTVRQQAAQPAKPGLQQTVSRQSTASPERFGEISGYDGPKKNVNRRYSLEELTKLGERNVIPSASFTNPGAGVALSEASGGRASLALGGANPITQYQREVGAAQSRNRATNERATATINARPDETTQRLMSGAESALGAGQKRKAAGFVDLLQAYNGGKPSDALERQRKPQEPTPDEEAMAAIQRQKEESSAAILGIQAGQAKRAYQLQEALLAAPPEEQGAIKAQLDAVMGRNAPQAKPDPGAITPKDQFANLGRLAAAELDPVKKAALIAQQKALEPPPEPGAQRGNDGNWYVMKNGQMNRIDP